MKTRKPVGTTRQFVITEFGNEPFTMSWFPGQCEAACKSGGRESLTVWSYRPSLDRFVKVTLLFPEGLQNHCEIGHVETDYCSKFVWDYVSLEIQLVLLRLPANRIYDIISLVKARG